jgi:hypothetical protein
VAAAKIVLGFMPVFGSALTSVEVPAEFRVLDLVSRE